MQSGVSGRWRAAWVLGAGLVVSALGGLLFDRLSLPLAWILGSMVASAIFANTVAQPAAAQAVRRMGQLIVGAATGAVLSRSVLGELVAFLPMMVGAAVAANLASIAISPIFARIAGTDQKTALLSTLPAGLSAMAPLAMEVNAQSDIVTVAHTMRVLLVVVFIPFYFGFLGHGTMAETAVPGASYTALLTCLLLSVVIAGIASRLGLLNPWVVVPMGMAVVLVALGWPLEVMPHILVVVAQIFIGFSLGARLKLSVLLRIPRAAIASAVCAGLLIAFVAFVMVPALHLLTGIDSASLGMSLAPGGLGEMIAAAKALGAGSALVAGFQFTRSFMTNIVAPPIIVRLGRAGNTDPTP